MSSRIRGTLPWLMDAETSQRPRGLTSPNLGLQVHGRQEGHPQTPTGCKVILLQALPWHLNRSFHQQPRPQLRKTLGPLASELKLHGPTCLLLLTSQLYLLSQPFLPNINASQSMPLPCGTSLRCPAKAPSVTSKSHAQFCITTGSGK